MKSASGSSRKKGDAYREQWWRDFLDCFKSEDRDREDDIQIDVGKIFPRM
jgi:hypothetical protein